MTDRLPAAKNPVAESLIERLKARTAIVGVMPYTPGPGLGGYCIPIDPFDN